MKTVLSGATVANTKPLLKKALDAQRKQLRSLESQKDNPSVAQNYYETKGRVEALEALNEHFMGSSVNLKMLS